MKKLRVDGCETVLRIAYNNQIIDDRRTILMPNNCVNVTAIYQTLITRQKISILSYKNIFQNVHNFGCTFIRALYKKHSLFK